MIKDIYGRITLIPDAEKIIKLPEFERLDDIKQLGCCGYVFPKAQHTRYSHSIGVAYLAQRTISQLQKNQPELGITDSEVKCVTLAGLFHDIGHGPFSHFYDSWLHHRGTSEPWCEHEYRSGVIIQYMVDKYDLDITMKEISMIQSMINPIKIPKDRRFLYQIIANKDFNLDVDKIDYLYRDAKTLQTGYHKFVSVYSIIDNIRVHKNNLVLHEMNEMDVLNIFTMRYMFHKDTYNSVDSVAVNCLMEKMFDILQDEGDDNLIVDNESQIDKFLTYTDSVIESKLLEYPASARLYAIILSRSWWKSIGKFSITKRVDYGKLKNRLNEVKERYPSIEIVSTKIGLVSGDKPNPLRCINFYADGGEDKIEEEKIHKLDKFVLFHKNYQEIVIYVYRKSDIERRNEQILKTISTIIYEEEEIDDHSIGLL